MKYFTIFHLFYWFRPTAPGTPSVEGLLTYNKGLTHQRHHAQFFIGRYSTQCACSLNRLEDVRHSLLKVNVHMETILTLKCHFQVVFDGKMPARLSQPFCKCMVRYLEKAKMFRSIKNSLMEICKVPSKTMWRRFTDGITRRL